MCWTTIHQGIPITVPARTVIDRAPQLPKVGVERLVREALRSKLLTVPQLQVAIEAHPGRRGTAYLRTFAALLAGRQIERAKSDPEAYALQILAAAGVPPPRVNRTVAGGEADFWWPELGLIIEIDGPNWHQFFDEDAAKQARWEAAGLCVNRISSDDVYRRPGKLLALAPAAT